MLAASVCTRVEQTNHNNLTVEVTKEVGTKFRGQVIKPLMKAGWLEMTIPDKPTNSKHKYRLTELGRKLIVVHK